MKRTHVNLCYTSRNGNICAFTEIAAKYIAHNDKAAIICKTGTDVKCAFADVRYVVRDLYACQTGGAKRSPANACYAVRDRYTRQAGFGKRTLANACYAVRDRYTRQTAATKCIVPDARYTVRDCYARQTETIKRTVADARHAGFNDN